MLYNPELQALATPTQLQNYADVLVNAGLGKGTGIKPGDVVLIRFEPEAALLLPYIQTSVTKAGGHLLRESKIPYPPVDSPTYAVAAAGTPEQIAFFPTAPLEALYKETQHFVFLRSLAYNEPNPYVNNPLYQTRLIVERTLRDIERDYKENHWQSYTLGYVPTIASAAQSGISLVEFWDEIVTTCYLNEPDAASKMKQLIAQTSAIESAINALNITHLHVTGPNANLHIGLVPQARFRSSRGGNIPSFECFVTPDAEQTSGWIRFSYPLIFEGTSIKDLHVTFTNGEVSHWTTSSGAETFAAMLALPGMNRLGEFALTDKRLSLISRVIPGAPVFLENIGGTGHVAFGRGYKKCFVDVRDTPHCNESIDHRDVVFGQDFTVTATCADQSNVVLFADGRFNLEI